MVTYSVAAIKIAHRAMYADGDLSLPHELLYSQVAAVYSNYKEYIAYAEAVKGNLVNGDYYDVLGRQVREAMVERGLLRIRDDSWVQLIGRGRRVARSSGPHGERY